LAAKHILKGDKVIDAAMRYGYDTPGGFNRAFKNKLGYSPKVLKALRLADTIFSNIGEIVMDANVLYQNLRKKMSNIFTDEDLKMFDRAYNFASDVHKNQRRYSGEDYITHPLNVSLILLDLKEDLKLVILGLLHDTLVDCKDEIFNKIKSQFGDEIALPIRRIDEIDVCCSLLEEDENIILVKLADRLHNMKTVEFLDKDRWEEKAKETFAIFSPLAESVGMKELKLELNHLSAKYMK
jgi:GTP pyrophosphokinase